MHYACLTFLLELSHRKDNNRYNIAYTIYHLVFRKSLRYLLKMYLFAAYLTSVNTNRPSYMDLIEEICSSYDNPEKTIHGDSLVSF